MLQLKFEADQKHQLDAINSIVGLFEGLPHSNAAYELSADAVAANLPEDDEMDTNVLLGNLIDVQRRNGFDTHEQSTRLEIENASMLDAVGGGSHQFPSFTIEMETGTGKTYVYLRSIFELRRRYGFGKFIVVVPSVAIYEGARKSFQIMRDHFRELYDNEPVNLVEYDGSQIGKLGGFARSTATEILLITLASFDKGSNVIYKPSEKLPGEWKPIEYIQHTRPIVILDEPQRMGGDAARKAIRSLMPLLTLRFSATHRENPNRVYRLTPIDAFRQNLVKKIEVIGVSERENANAPELALREISKGSGFQATVRTVVIRDGTAHEENVVLHPRDDLYNKTRHPNHRDGYRVANIAGPPYEYVEFENGVVLGLRDTHGATTTAIFRAQIARTIETHLHAQSELRDKGIKVLSLFFVDRVSHYTDDDGIIKRLFDQEFDRLKTESAYFKYLKPEDAREAYFAKKKGKGSDEDEVIGDLDQLAAKDRQAAEKTAYALIMRDKEKLLSFDEKKCFIFAHSALREGWDNPNVFQICTLREAASDIERRQAIGRGLRLCVDQTGARVRDEDVNLLTVVANESYREFADGLQREYQLTGDQAPPAPKLPRQNEARRNDRIYSDGFQGFWQKLIQPLEYRLTINTDELVENAIARLNKADYPTSVIMVERGRVVIDECAIAVNAIGASKANLTLRLLDENGDARTITGDYRESVDLVHATNNKNMKPFGRFRIIKEDGASKLAFGNNIILATGERYSFAPSASNTVHERATVAPATRYPVFNLIDRVARELELTRPTINRVFRGMRDEKKRNIFKNPEGFAGVFITELRNALADHVTRHIRFVATSDITYSDPDELFPGLMRYPQKEIVPAGEHGLYDMMQTDSEEERTFVEAVRRDPKVAFYFKFPPRFRIRLPRVIGDYNPDWGIGRIDESGKPVIHKVRETKGNEDLSKLRFPHERRKIACAARYFTQLGIDYRPIKGDTPDWWQPQTSTELLSI